MRRTLILVATAAVLLTAMPAALAARRQLPLQRTNWVLTDRVSIGTPLAEVSVDAVFDGTRVQRRARAATPTAGATPPTAGASRLQDDGVHDARGVRRRLPAKVEPDVPEARLVTGRRRYRITRHDPHAVDRAGRRLLVVPRLDREVRAARRVERHRLLHRRRDPVGRAGSTLTLEFADSRASGNGGCNTFDGGYHGVGASTASSIGPLAATLRACADSAREHAGDSSTWRRSSSR